MSRYAVTIGTNYEGTPYQLSGCVNDATDWAALLTSENYIGESLTGNYATRSNILGALTDAVAEAGWGDRVVVQYSGHGTNVFDRSGDEIDRRDEAWCPDDMQTSGLVTDDDLYEIFSKARPGVGILVISDSCFSGTMTRFMPAAGKPKFLPPNFRDILPSEAAELEERVPLTRAYTNRASLISGSEETDVSYDAWFGERANGAFTRAAIDSHVRGMSLGNWHKAIRQRLPSSSYPQSPQLLPASLYRRYARAL